MDSISLPIIYFLSNLYRIGVTVAVMDGRLRIGGAVEKLSPAYRDEIKRRAELIVGLLSPPVPGPLRSYTGRLLKVQDAEHAQEIANQMDVSIRLTPTNGGWMMTL